MPKKSSESRRTMIVTFKKKDKRSKSDDKQTILQSAIDSDLNFVTADTVSTQARPVASGQDMMKLGYDVNRYEAPILIANLTDEEIKKLKADDDIARVEEDGQMYALATPRALDDPGALAQTIPPGVTQVKAPDAWPSSMGEGIKVFICDTGIDSDHPDLVANLRTGKSFVPTESTTEDFNGHGTHCAGTVAAVDNDIGVVGVAPYAYLYPVKVLSSSGSGNWSWLIAALDWIMSKKGARIASMSLGGGGAPQALGDMCEAAYDDGVLLVAAAGNSGNGVQPLFPARYPHVMAVSAIDFSDQLAAFSNTGAEIELAAPGVGIRSTTRGGGYGNLSGTSMACPHVAGAAALTWGSHRSVNNKQVRWLLNTFADKIGDQDPNKFGNGRVDCNTSAFWIGTPQEHQL
ncbi:MAG: S8 family peptidase [Erythrobacter sp.]|jgi:subtilisin|nr:S8 family peptidase [Erythrobacter sp.]